VVVEDTGARLPRPMSHLAAASLGSRLYIAGGAEGGSDSAIFAATEIANPAACKLLATWPGSPRRDAALVAQGGAEANHLFLMAGTTAGAPLADAYRYDPARDTWATLSPLPEPVAQPKAAPLSIAHV